MLRILPRSDPKLGCRVVQTRRGHTQIGYALFTAVYIYLPDLSRSVISGFYFVPLTDLKCCSVSCDGVLD